MVSVRAASGVRAMTTTHPAELERSEAGGQNPFAAPIARLTRVHSSLLAKHRGYALLVEIVLKTRDHDPSLLAKQAAYSLLYAVPSMLIMLISLAAIVDK